MTGDGVPGACDGLSQALKYAQRWKQQALVNVQAQTRCDEDLAQKQKDLV